MRQIINVNRTTTTTTTIGAEVDDDLYTSLHRSFSNPDFMGGAVATFAALGLRNMGMPGDDHDHGAEFVHEDGRGAPFGDTAHGQQQPGPQGVQTPWPQGVPQEPAPQQPPASQPAPEQQTAPAPGEPGDWRNTPHPA